MYIAGQGRDGDLDTFLNHENHPWPPSLAQNNIMHLGNKSDLMHCLEDMMDRLQETQEAEVRILDGAALVHVPDPKGSSVTARTFRKYADKVILPFIDRQIP